MPNELMKTLTIGANTYDLPQKTSDLTNDSGFTTNSGTVTSVRVQATSPVQSSTNTAQSTTLNTTISLADNYGDTKNPYASKTKNYVLAAPSSANGVPSFRALVADDIPSLTKSKISDFPSIPTKTSDLTNDSGYLTSAVTSFNGNTGAVTYTAPVTSVNGSTGAVTVAVPTKTSDLTNDSGFITSTTADDTYLPKSVTTSGGLENSITYAQPSREESSVTITSEYGGKAQLELYTNGAVYQNGARIKVGSTSSPTTTFHVYYANASSNTYTSISSTNTTISSTTTTINGVVTPTADGMAANKKYVDDSITAAIGTAIGGSY